MIIDNYRKLHQITPEEHLDILQQLGWTEQNYTDGFKRLVKHR